MARHTRIDPAGASHHITNRGARQQDTFVDDTDREVFLGLVVDACEKFGAMLVSYCLMTNHYHLVLHCPDGNVSAVVQMFASNYTRAFNKAHGFDGRLNTARFHNEVLSTFGQLITTLRYDDRNPVEIGYDPIEYPWSSSGAYVGRRPTPEWLASDFVLEPLGGAQRYFDFVSSDWPSDKAPWSRGTKSFPRQPRRTATSLSLQSVQAAAAQALGVDVLALQRARTGPGATARAVAVIVAIDSGRVNVDVIAAFFGFNSAASARSVASRVRRNIKSDAGLGGLVAACEATLRSNLHAVRSEAA